MTDNDSNGPPISEIRRVSSVPPYVSSSGTVGTKDEDLGTHRCNEAESAAGADGTVDGQSLEWGVHQAASRAERHGKAKGEALLKRKPKQALFPYTAMPPPNSSTPNSLPEQGEPHRISEISRKRKW